MALTFFRNARRMLPRTAVVVVAAVIPTLFAGCGSQYPTLTFTSLDIPAAPTTQAATQPADPIPTTARPVPIVLTQPFSIAAMARDPDGDWDAVLVSQGMETPRPLWKRVGTALNPAEYIERSTDAGQDLTPTTSPPVRQVVHMKIHWRPRRGSDPENPAAANSTVRWLIYGAVDPTGHADLIEYQGTAFVRIDFESNGYTLGVRRGTLRRTLLRGDMVDVFGTATLDGDLAVRNDPETVANVVRELPTAAPEVLPPEMLKPPTPASRPTTRLRPRELE